MLILKVNSYNFFYFLIDKPCHMQHIHRIHHLNDCKYIHKFHRFSKDHTLHIYLNKNKFFLEKIKNLIFFLNSLNQKNTSDQLLYK